MRLLATELLAKKSAYMDYLRLKASRCKRFLGPRHAQQVAMIIVERTNDVVADFLHLKKTNANAQPRHATDLLNRGVQAIQR